MSLNRILRGFNRAVSQLEKYEKKQSDRISLYEEVKLTAEEEISKADSEKTKAASIRNKLTELLS